MALQDLTPQLRTRLSRLERLVGWFITLATLLLLVGLSYYVYETARRKGWFLHKVSYFTFVRNAAGLKVGDRVKLMGFDVGEITVIDAMPPEDEYFNVYVQFRVIEPFYGYLWEDSRAKVGAADFLGNRFIEVTKGSVGVATYAMHEIREVTLAEARELVGGTNYVVFGQFIPDASHTTTIAHPSKLLSHEALQQLAEMGLEQILVLDKAAPVKVPRWMWDDKAGRYKSLTGEEKGYWLRVEESPALTERLENVINTVEAALPDFLALTNKVNAVLTSADHALVQAGDLLANGQTAQTNLNALSGSLLASLDHVATLTSNLAAQVQANGLILSDISDLILHTDDMVQGLKRHWLLKSAFAPETNTVPQSILHPRLGGAR